MEAIKFFHEIILNMDELRDFVEAPTSRLVTPGLVFFCYIYIILRDKMKNFRQNEKF